jgi:Asp-tRNA(Asn)/Glu-tRNA(Gln) amidotransferase A subunit family amidase
VFAGFSRMLEFAERGVAGTKAFDFVLTPTAPMTAFPAELASPSDDPQNPFPHIGYTVGFNMSGQPALSINCGFDAKGLPIGLQIVGRRFDDVGVLALARAYEDVRSAEMRPWPEPPGRA